MKKLFLSLIALLTMVTVSAQVQTVTGVVFGADDGEPLAGVSVQPASGGNGVATDVDGRFTIQVPQTVKQLQFSYVGMVTKTVSITGKPLRVALETADNSLNEVMVVAFGTAKKSAYTGSAKVVASDELEKSQVTSVTDALAGAVPGVQLVSSNGAPGSTSTIRIRGFGSINASNNPLIVVDGAPYSGDLANINPADVESMTVLKDAASTALYGARGANGVVIITTKKAKYGDAVVTLDAKYGWNTRALQQYDVITDPRQYYEMHYSALNSYYKNQGMSDDDAWIKSNDILTSNNSGGLGYNIFTYPEDQLLIGKNGKVNPEATIGRLVNYNGEDYWVTPDDWDALGRRTGVRQEYNLSISGATDRSSFLISLGYLDNEGITENSDYKRLSARLRGDYKAKSWLTVGGNFNYARYDSNVLSNNGSSNSSGNIWAFTSQLAPIYPAYIRDANGNVKIDDDGIAVMDYGNGKNAGYARAFIGDANPIQDNKLNTQNGEGNVLAASGFADIIFTDWLKLTVNGTTNLDEGRSTYVYNPYYGQFDSTGGTVEKYHTRSYDYNVQQLLSFNKQFNKVHNVDVLAGHEYYDYRYYLVGASKSKMFSQDNKELDGAVVDGQASTSYKSRYNVEGWLARAQYDYDSKYFLSASIRRDASSRFAPEHRWGTFWSAGAAWLLNKESWFNAPWVQELKLKASYGENGNDGISAYRYTDLYTIVNSSGNIGTSFASKGTEDITWETVHNINVGAEFMLWNRLSGSVEYYYRKTTDMLFSFSVAPSLGYSSYYDNVGDMYNTGLEIDLSANIFRTRDFSWDVNLNLSTIKNRITKLHPDKKTSTLYDADLNEYKGYSTGNFFIAEGTSLYTWRFKEYAGVDQTTGQSLWYKNVKDDDGNITGERETTTSWSDADYYVTNETSIPKFYGGFGTTIRAYGFDLSANFTYQVGGKQYDGTYAQFMASPIGSTTGYNFHKDLLNSWSTENTTSDIPRFQFGDTYSAGASTRFLTNASYLNFQNLNFGYTLPSDITKKALINNLRIYLSCENLCYWSKRKGFDPRQSFSGTTDATSYSPMRTVSCGAQITF
jgi:TonB-linked SusC/RagA family outer membrane protein